MPVLRIFRPTMLRTPQPLLFEFQSGAAEGSQHGVIRDDYAELELPPGAAGRIVLFVPDGSQLVAPIRMEAEDESIKAFTSTSPSSTRLDKFTETPSFSSSSAVRNKRQLYAAHNGALSFSVAESAIRQVVPPSTENQPVHCRLWTYDWERSRSWQVVDSSQLGEIGIEDSNLTLRLELPIGVPYLLQYGHELFGVQNTVLPPGTITIHMLYIDAPGDRADQIVFDIDLSDSIAESIVAFLQNGQTDRANLMASAVLNFETASGADPLAAIVGCYFLLKARRLDVLERWLKTLPDVSQRMPDAWIIRGWWLIQSQSKNIEEIESVFTTAAVYGLPVFTEGLRLLVEGTRLLDELPAMQAFSERLARYYSVVSGDQPYTTFAGIDPNEPVAQSNAPQLDALKVADNTFWLKAQ